MGKIIILDENTAAMIAAGEVIERPASVVKELVENSIDAGAANIRVEIRNGGIRCISVADDGSGIGEDDVETAFERHATSKIRKPEDLERISSMGFRGEALASIAAVSDVQMTTRTGDSVQGTFIEVKGGCVIDKRPAGCPVGTSIAVRELFFNTPARYKFLKKDSIEAGYVSDILGRIALGRPDISFRLSSNGAVVLHTPGNGDLKSAVFSIYGAETAKNLVEVNYRDEFATVRGYAGKPEIARSARSHQVFFVNGRYIKSRTIAAAVDEAYATYLMKNRYAFVLLDIVISPAFVDVNVHPSKMEVKFSSEQAIYRAVCHAVNGALVSGITARRIAVPGMPAGRDENTAGSGIHVRVRPERQEQPAFEQPEGHGQFVFEHPEGQGRPAFERHTVRGMPGCEKQYFDAVKGELDRIWRDAAEGKRQEEQPRPAEYPEGRQDGGKAGLLAEDATGFALFSGVRIIGQAFLTYILLERDDELLLLDQHAAHERIRYEELKKAYADNKVYSQMLMDVVHVELAPGEYRFAMDEMPFFEKLGFTYESFGANSLILRSVPLLDGGADMREMFLDILDHVMDGKNREKSIVADEALYKMACKSAVKANRALDPKEIEAMLERLEHLENPYTCPHGRPVLFVLKRYELEKLFKRIV